MKKIADWFDVEHDVEVTENKVVKAFEKWYKANITITHGSGRNAEEIFGLPYTSSSQDEDGDFYGSIWNCQAEAYLNADPQWKFRNLVISRDMEIVAVFDREDTGNFDDKEIIIGKLA